MKKPVVKMLSLILCALLVLGSAKGAACAADNPSTGEKNRKDETVYVLARADGSVDKIIVSNWVQNSRGDDTIADVTRLTDIENCKGDETFTLGGENSCVWDARGNDIYYQGSIDQELPVSVAVSYTLDGQAVTAEALAGKSGKVVIRFEYTNNQYELVEINGEQQKIYVPFAMLTGMVLDNQVFRNVSVSNGKIINDGERTIVAGLAFPGLQDSLGLNREDLSLPEYVQITADVENFALENTVTLAANGLLGDGLDKGEKLDELENVDGKLNKLTDAMGQLMDGSSRLYDGLCTLLDSSTELVSGIDELADGAAQLRQGSQSLSAGASQLTTGADALRQGLDALSQNSDALNGGAAQIFQSLLYTANTQLAAAGVQTPELTVENYAQVLDGAIAAAGDSPAGQQVAALKASLDSYNSFYQGLLGYTAGVAQAQSGAGELSQGLGSLKGGAESLSAGAEQLYDGILTMQNGAPALIDGVTQLRDGAMELHGGLEEFNREGVQKLVDAFHGDLNGLADRLDALRAVSERYTSFSGAGPDMDSQVRFVWRTEAVEAQ